MKNNFKMISIFDVNLTCKEVYKYTFHITKVKTIFFLSVIFWADYFNLDDITVSVCMSDLQSEKPTSLHLLKLLFTTSSLSSEKTRAVTQQKY